MYKVILVDDERAIRQGLKAIVDWRRHGFEVIGEAGNGREALLRHQELKPDLMVMDVRMPGVDGLQVIEEIRKSDKECQFIILSGHADFSYAKRAISWGVNAYLLKPVDTDEFDAELDRIGGVLREASGSLQKKEQTSAQQLEDQIVSLLMYDEEGHRTAMEPPKEPDLDWRSYRVMLLKLHPPLGSHANGRAEVRRKLAERFESSGTGIVFATEPFVGVLLNEREPNKLQANSMYLHLEESLLGLNGGFSAAAGDPVHQLADIGLSYSQAVRLLKEEFLFRGERTVILKRPPLSLAANGTRDGETAGPDINALADKLFYALDIGSKDAVRRILDEGVQSIATYDGAEQAMKTAVSQWISLALTKLSKTSDTAFTAVQDALSIVAEIYEQPDLRSLRQMLEDRLLGLTERISTFSSESAVKQILDFVERHYAENLKLETLAELFNYNSGYLGKMFKSFTGDTFHNYLDKVRIRNAKHLLAGGLKVHQVATRVGYASADYFHLKFKKYLGESPSRYKMKQSKITSV
ncbi:response regulator transcription factor [Paenibacillus sedimenti]|uniref:Response regulator transcription factor n=1 Tax=Paenibacillus sedimenti TaxID=2770274 RepID=A0A926KIU2_9BACL|nr:response regulator transcription factor [Paenibacillus sedimenti]MBD0378512.1 response regulator transcription factor [Paenibacillus sedimenti]